VFGKRYEIFRLFGFSIRIDPSWVFIVVLVTWSLAKYWFPESQPELSSTTYWAMGLAGTLGLFASVVLHELSHALVARRHGLPMRGITLFIFGGVAEMVDEPPNAKAEFQVAVAGPLASIAIAGICQAIQALGKGLDWPAPVVGVIAYLAVINFVLVVFNAVPAFPLDGGRVLRSLLWWWKDNLRWATRVSSTIGSGFGVFLIVMGVINVFSGQFVAGMWWFLIGLFLRGAAQSSYQQLLLRRFLEGEPVRRFMHDDPITVSRAIPVRELVEQQIYRHHHKLYPVMDGDRLVGCVTTRKVKELPREEWDRQSVGAITESCSDENTIGADEDAMDALSKMNRNHVSRLMVMDGDRLVGILALKDLLRFFSLKVELEGDAG
jgi:Zn-dependent protease/CBS domain-containing protein